MMYSVEELKRALFYLERMASFEENIDDAYMENIGLILKVMRYEVKQAEERENYKNGL